MLPQFTSFRFARRRSRLRGCRRLISSRRDAMSRSVRIRRVDNGDRDPPAYAGSSGLVWTAVLHKADRTMRCRCGCAAKACTFVNCDVAGTVHAREQHDRCDLVWCFVLCEPQEPSTETPSGEVRCNHQPADLPRRALLARSNRTHKPAVYADAPCRPGIDPSSYVPDSLMQRRDIKSVVGDGFIDPAAPL